jgi:hypothetical protein
MSTSVKWSLLILVAILAAAADGLLVYAVKTLSGQPSAVASPAKIEALTKPAPPVQNETAQSQEIPRTPPVTQTTVNPTPAGATEPKEPLKEPAAKMPPSPVSASRKPSPAAVVGNSDSKRYHLPGMAYYDRVETYHRVEFRSEEEAVKAGYRKAAR